MAQRIKPSRRKFEKILKEQGWGQPRPESFIPPAPPVPSSKANPPPAQSGGEFSPFPIVRRVFPQLRASQLVSVQPMSMPTGLVFYRAALLKKIRRSGLKVRRKERS